MDPLENQSELASYFAEALIDQNYKDSLDESSFLELKQDLIEKINREISQTIFDNLSDEQLTEMEEILEEGDGAKVSEFLRSAIPDLRSLILEKLINLKEEFNF